MMQTYTETRTQNQICEHKCLMCVAPKGTVVMCQRLGPIGPYNRTLWSSRHD
jgi:hypothetical protein